MRIIDARSGEDVVVGQYLKNQDATIMLNPDGSRTEVPNEEGFTILQVKEGLFKAEALMKIYYDGRWHEPQWVPMPVHYLHPSFFLQKIAFVPS